MRLFVLERSEDPSGVSGVGVVAEGVVFSSGKTVISWLTAVTSVAVYDSVEELMHIHSHGGLTTLRWLT